MSSETNTAASTPSSGVLHSEIGARLRFECAWRKHNELDYRFVQPKKDYFRLRGDFNELLRVLRTVFSDATSNERCIAAERLECVLLWRQIDHHCPEYHAIGASPPRALSHYALIDVKYSEELTCINST